MFVSATHFTLVSFSNTFQISTKIFFNAKSFLKNNFFHLLKFLKIALWPAIFFFILIFYHSLTQKSKNKNGLELLITFTFYIAPSLIQPSILIFYQSSVAFSRENMRKIIRWKMYVFGTENKLTYEALGLVYIKKISRWRLKFF